jgi:hypothetical protein
MYKGQLSYSWSGIQILALLKRLQHELMNTWFPSLIEATLVSASYCSIIGNLHSTEFANL